ncbi:hypothetical protein AB835_14470 [Candidatus Endobugula sertula]|uniref:Uncharacterized protein n=1 Tax=Candidatus Endobugula sertula TaxID=62101 RepID=A0A1D2QLD9_9GAMM|nr:hypothetical protein AB835_14470 [Candidatus Endobugula sertula]
MRQQYEFAIKTGQTKPKSIQKISSKTLFCKAREMLRALKDFQESATGYVISTVAAATTIASLTFSDAAQAENPVTAQPVAATQSLNAGERGLDGVQGIQDMEEYSRDASIQGVGIFINLQKNPPLTGEQIGEIFRNKFGEKKVPVQYRYNQSRGTATNITFYIKGVNYTYNISEVIEKFDTLVSRHSGAWTLETAALDDNNQTLALNQQ